MSEKGFRPKLLEDKRKGPSKLLVLKLCCFACHMVIFDWLLELAQRKLKIYFFLKLSKKIMFLIKAR